MASFGLEMKNALANWASALTDENAFNREQTQLGRFWTLLGVTHDLAKDGDWIRATLGGRSVFVQRFGDTFRGYENRCAHRFYPLRNADKGNGPVVCGFHHWRYDQEGTAVGVPMCPELFGVAPRALNARLTPIEVATCGTLVFGRFAEAGLDETLDAYLGESFPILEAITRTIALPYTHGRSVKANWKLCNQITMDDYHIVAVHHKQHYHSNADLQYIRFGMHSAHFVGHADSLASMSQACRAGNYRPDHYRIFNIFPNLAVSLFRASFKDAPHWYFNVQQFVPVSPASCEHRGWFRRAEFIQDERGGIEPFLQPVIEPWRARAVRFYQDRTAREDHDACERLQSVAHQIEGEPILGSQETRIGWFEEAYAKATS